MPILNLTKEILFKCSHHALNLNWKSRVCSLQSREARVASFHALTSTDARPFLLSPKWPVFCFPQNDPWNAEFSNKPNFLRVTLTKRNYCLDLTLFPTAGFASILAPQSVKAASTTHTWPPSWIIGVCGLKSRTKKQNKKGLLKVYAITFHCPLNISFFLRRSGFVVETWRLKAWKCNSSQIPAFSDRVVRITIGPT